MPAAIQPDTKPWPLLGWSGLDQPCYTALGKLPASQGHYRGYTNSCLEGHKPSVGLLASLASVNSSTGCSRYN